MSQIITRVCALELSRREKFVILIKLACIFSKVVYIMNHQERPFLDRLRVRN